VTAPVGLQEIEEVDAPEVDAAVLVPRETRRCACRNPRPADQVRHRDIECIPFAFIAEVADPYPAPEVTSRDEWDRQGAPLAVAKQVQKAVAAGWQVRVQRSRGSLPHALHGTPTAVKTLHAVIVRKGDASAYAVYDGTKWSSVTTWGGGAPWFAGMASITDFAEYLAADGRMPKAWYTAIRKREAGKVARGKTRDGCNTGRHESASLAAGVWTCADCGNSWGAKDRPWRRASTTTKDTAR
jgi:ribosomal protein L37AE/L43A